MSTRFCDGDIIDACLNIPVVSSFELSSKLSTSSLSSKLSSYAASFELSSELSGIAAP